MRIKCVNIYKVLGTVPGKDHQSISCYYTGCPSRFYYRQMVAGSTVLAKTYREFLLWRSGLGISVAAAVAEQLQLRF